MIKAHLIGQTIFSNEEEAFSLNEKSSFGEKVGEKIQYTLAEALYLIEKKKIELYNQKKKITFKDLLEKTRKVDKNIQIKYPVFKDLRDKGYIVKTALKFGADLRVYDKGIRPGKDHAKWLLYTVHESQRLTWHEFSAKNRVAHSTKKNLLIAIVDEEGDITYYEIRWVRT